MSSQERSFRFRTSGRCARTFICRQWNTRRKGAGTHINRSLIPVFHDKKKKKKWLRNKPRKLVLFSHETATHALA